MAERLHRNCTRLLNSVYSTGRYEYEKEAGELVGTVRTDTMQYKRHRAPLQIIGAEISYSEENRLNGELKDRYDISMSLFWGVQWVTPTMWDFVPGSPEEILRADTAPDIAYGFAPTDEALKYPPRTGVPLIFVAYKSFAGTLTSQYGTSEIGILDAITTIGDSFTFVDWVFFEFPSPGCPVDDPIGGYRWNALDLYQGYIVKYSDFPIGNTLTKISLSTVASKNGIVSNGYFRNDSYGSTATLTRQINHSATYWPVRTYPHLIEGYDGPSNPAGQPGPCPQPTIPARLFQPCNRGSVGGLLVAPSVLDVSPFGEDPVVRINGECYRSVADVESLRGAVTFPEIEEGFDNCEDCLANPVPCWRLESCGGSGEEIIVAKSEIDKVPGIGTTIVYDRKCWTKVAEVEAEPNEITAEQIDGRFDSCESCIDANDLLYVVFSACKPNDGPSTFYVLQSEYYDEEVPPQTVNLKPVFGYSPGCYRMVATDVTDIPDDALILGPNLPRVRSCGDPLCGDLVDFDDAPIDPRVAQPRTVSNPLLNPNENAIQLAIQSDPLRRCRGCGQ